jgi:hypothetical protein
MEALVTKTSRAIWMPLLAAFGLGFSSTAWAAELPTLALTGPAISIGGKLFAAPAVGFQMGNGTRIEVNGKEVTGAGLGTPWTSGDYTVVALTDAPGGAVRGTPLSFQVDADPPAFRWETTDRDIFESRGEPRVRSFRRDREQVRQRGDDSKERRTTTGVLYSSDGRGWLPLIGRGDKLPEVKILSDHPQLFLRGEANLVSEDGKRIDLDGGKMLWIEAADAGCGVESMVVRVRPASQADGAMTLEVEAVDLLGNTKRLNWNETRSSN